MPIELIILDLLLHLLVVTVPVIYLDSKTMYRVVINPYLYNKTFILKNISNTVIILSGDLWVIHIFNRLQRSNSYPTY